MPIKEADRVTGGAFCNLKELAEEAGEDGMLMWFRIVDWEDEDEPASKGDYGWNMPFLYDAIAIPRDADGERDGEPRVWLRQSMKFGNGPMWTLRGHERPDLKLKRSELPKPANDVGDEIMGVIKLKYRGKGNDRKSYPVLNKPTAAEKAILLAVREELGGDDWGAGDDGAPF